MTPERDPTFAAYALEIVTRRDKRVAESVDCIAHDYYMMRLADAQAVVRFLAEKMTRQTGAESLLTALAVMNAEKTVEGLIAKIAVLQARSHVRIYVQTAAQMEVPA